MKYVVITPGRTVQYDVPAKNVQKGVGGMMRGAMIETSARRILSQGINETKKKTALRILQDGELSIDKIAKYSGLEVAEVEQLAGLQTV